MDSAGRADARRARLALFPPPRPLADPPPAEGFFGHALGRGERLFSSASTQSNAIAYPVGSAQSAPPYARLGRAMPLAEWLKDKGAAERVGVTAAGYGEATFAAFYPCRSSISFLTKARYLPSRCASSISTVSGSRRWLPAPSASGGHTRRPPTRKIAAYPDGLPPVLISRAAAQFLCRPGTCDSARGQGTGSIMMTGPPLCSGARIVELPPQAIAVRARKTR